MKDLVSDIAVVPALAPAVQSASIDSAVIDRAGYESVTYVLNAGAVAGSGAFSAKVQHSDDGTTFSDVPADFIIGGLPATLVANSSPKIGYWGHKRYTKLVTTKASGTSIALGVVAILGHAHARPVA